MGRGATQRAKRKIKLEVQSQRERDLNSQLRSNIVEQPADRVRSSWVMLYTIRKT